MGGQGGMQKGLSLNRGCIFGGGIIFVLVLFVVVLFVVSRDTDTARLHQDTCNIRLVFFLINHEGNFFEVPSQFLCRRLTVGIQGRCGILLLLLLVWIRRRMTVIFGMGGQDLLQKLQQSHSDQIGFQQFLSCFNRMLQKLIQYLSL